MHNFSFKITFLILSLFFLPFFAHAATLSSLQSKGVYDRGEEFSIPIYLISTPEEPVNAFSVTISYPGKLVHFVSSDETGSIVPLWVERPHLQGNEVTLAGTIPGGFTDVFDPLLQSHSPGLLTTLIFHPDNAGEGAIIPIDIELYKNDGLGTKIETDDFTVPILVSDHRADRLYVPNDSLAPLPFTISLEQNELLFKNRYFIAFGTTDHETGIDYYEVKEGAGLWHKTESPYELHDQTLSNTVSVRAVDKAGNVRTATLSPKNPSSHSTPWWSIGAALILFLVILIIFIRKKRKTE